jgi:hypothetical protein
MNKHGSVISAKIGKRFMLSRRVFISYENLNIATIIIVSKLKINDKISIGNIVGIDINENRKLLKDYYKVISKEDNGINENTGYIKVQLETIFPLRRIEKDSDKHRSL